MLPATGSTMIAATSGPRADMTASTADRSLNGTVMVSAASAAGTPRLSGTPKVAPPEPAFDEQAVGMSVVTPFELDNGVASRDASGQPDRAHRRFRARGDEAQHFHRGHGA
jgi:hypothetical protein